jgi:4'-phosphopantetheinyl transferase
MCTFDPQFAIDCWTFRASDFYTQESKCFALLDPGEQGRATAFTTENLRREYTIAHGALRVLLGRHTSTDPAAVQLTSGPLGKPYLADHSYFFNLSHSGDVVAIALCKSHEIGVDIEHLKPEILEKQLQHALFSSKELGAFHQKAPKEKLEAFFTAWTHKESLLKLLGVGLSKELKEVEVPLDLLDRVTRVQLDNREHYLQSCYAYPDHILSVACSEPGFSLNIQPLTAL